MQEESKEEIKQKPDKGDSKGGFEPDFSMPSSGGGRAAFDLDSIKPVNLR